MTTTRTRPRAGRAVAAIVLTAALGASAALALHLTRPQEDPVNLTRVSQSREALAAAAGARTFFGHQSVGANVLDGVPEVYSRAGLDPPPVVESATPPDVAGGYMAHAYIGQNEDPESKMRQFASVVTGPMGDAVSVAVMKLCYVDITADTDVEALFKRYRRTMAQIAQKSDVTLLFATVPLTTDRGLVGTVKAFLGRGDTSPQDNAARERFNALVRAEYADTGRLWDIAAIESTKPDGSRVAGTHEGAPYYALNRDYASDAGHLNEAGSSEAAAALLELVAENARA